MIVPLLLTVATSLFFNLQSNRFTRSRKSHDTRSSDFVSKYERADVVPWLQNAIRDTYVESGQKQMIGTSFASRLCSDRTKLLLHCRQWPDSYPQTCLVITLIAQFFIWVAILQSKSCLSVFHINKSAVSGTIRRLRSRQS